MDSSIEVYATQALCQWLRQTYKYSEKECMAYINGYKTCESFYKEYKDSVMTLRGVPTDEKEYYQIIIDDDVK